MQFSTEKQITEIQGDRWKLVIFFNYLISVYQILKKMRSRKPDQFLTSNCCFLLFHAKGKGNNSPFSTTNKTTTENFALWYSGRDPNDLRANLPSPSNYYRSKHLVSFTVPLPLGEITGESVKFTTPLQTSLLYSIPFLLKLLLHRFNSLHPRKINQTSNHNQS